MKARDIAKARLERLEKIVTDLTAFPADIVQADSELPAARASLDSAQKRFDNKRQALGVEEGNQLQHLINSPFIRARMNALALKTRLRDRLRHRRFEIAPIERAHRRKGLDKQLRHHTQSAINRREPGIQAIARQYNTLVDSLARLVEQRRAPRNARIPSKVPMSGLFTLDINDEIWDDVGLTEDDEDVVPPAWLADDATRDGIRALLVEDRCGEENSRIVHERLSLQEWFSKEWEIIEHCLQDENLSPGLKYQFGLQRQKLLDLCATWKKATSWLSTGDTIPAPWGPSEDELSQASIDSNIDKVLDEDPDDDDVYESEPDDDDDAEYIAAIDAVHMADVFRDTSVVSNDVVEDANLW
ncbi:hypothetical protein ONZ45_g13876 [Pleurotus djamor]|nr:hypothetical protein ONZ45_g13876 [Pleurotus djamor]